MNNETIQEKSWLKRNWKWALPLCMLIFSGIGFLVSVVSTNDASNFTTAFADEALYAKAVERSNENEQVIDVLGKLEPIDNMAILESNIDYSNNKQLVNLSVRVKGVSGKGKMDVQAVKKDNEWQYSLIKIRIKEPKQEIIVLQ